MNVVRSPGQGFLPLGKVLISGGVALTLGFLVACGGGGGSASSSTTPEDSSVSHGAELTQAMVGPGAIGITAFVDVPGGYCTGVTYDRPRKVPEAWFAAGVVRTVGAGGERIDGHDFPAGTLVVQGANITSPVDIYGNQTDYGSGAVGIVFRGCRFRFAGLSSVFARPGHGIYVMVSYCDVGAKDQTQAEALSDGFKGGGEAGKPFIIKRNHISLTANAGELQSHLLIEENLADGFWSFPGDHVDGWQFEGGNTDITLRRNKVSMDPPYGWTGCFSFFNVNKGDTQDYGFHDVVLDDNYLAGGSYALYLPRSNFPVSDFKVRGNRWSTEFGANCGVYGPVYTNDPMNPATNGNAWSNNAWLDGPNAGAAVPVPGY